MSSNTCSHDNKLDLHMHHAKGDSQCFQITVFVFSLFFLLLTRLVLAFINKNVLIATENVHAVYKKQHLVSSHAKDIVFFLHVSKNTIFLRGRNFRPSTLLSVNTIILF